MSFTTKTSPLNHTTAIRYWLQIQVLAWLTLLLTTSIFAAEDAGSLESSFTQRVQPFLQQYCQRCHNPDKLTSGIRVDQLNGHFEDRHLKLWGGIRKQIVDEAMPPEGEAQPSNADRQRIVDWIQQGLDAARTRPTPKNGGARRLTVAQYRNTLRELLLIDDDLADILPPDAVSKDGFVNKQETLALSPLLLDAYFDIAEKALHRCIVDPKSKPSIQNFRVDLGEAINSDPCKDNLILGADSLLLNNTDFVVHQLTPQKPFAFEPFFMQTKFRFIEGYQGNDTVRGWRDYDSIYHAVFACMRGSHGYPKGRAYSTVPQGLLLRPAIPSAELFGVESTYGPRANFKISLRELPDDGQFRVIVTAAKYDDGLLLDAAATTAIESAGAVIAANPAATMQTVNIEQPGIYQVDAHLAQSDKPIASDASKLNEGLIGAWSLDGTASSNPRDLPPSSPRLNEQKADTLTGRLEGDAKFIDSPFGKAISLDGDGDAVVVPQNESMKVGTGDFTVAAWIHPNQLRQAGIVCLGKYSWTHGWYFDMPNNQGVLRIETAGPNNQSNGTVQTAPGAIRNNTWQHVAAVVRRDGKGETQLFVNGYPVAQGKIGAANLDNPKVDLNLGRIQEAHQFQGAVDEVRFYRRALDRAEIQALVESGRQFAIPPTREKTQELTLTLGGRQFIGMLNQPAFLAVRLAAGPLVVGAKYPGATKLDRLTFTPLVADHDVAKRFSAFEQRAPRVGVHLGLRRDCGSTLSQVGESQTVSGTDLARFVFTGAMRNFPAPEVEKDNVNYLAGIREIGVRSEYTDGRDMPRLLIRSVEFEGPYFETWPPVPHRNIYVDSDRQDDQPAYARQVIREFAARAFRRPITDKEHASLVAVFDQSLAGGASFRDSVKDALQVILTSPQFLFLIENSSTPNAEPVGEFELASKLSYFLWNSPPDRDTLTFAANGELRTRLDGEVGRLLEDSRSARFINEFTSQWLALDKFNVVEPDLSKFPKLIRDTRNQLRQEPVQYLQHLIRHNLPVRNLIESDFVVANEVVASYYDLVDKPESGFQFVAIPHRRRELGGVLSQAAIMSGLSDGRESNPVKRGAWLARRMIAEPPDDPPPNVPTLKEDTQQLSLRERLERHRNQPGCAQCHSKIDPWGVPFEEFDAGGRIKLQLVDAQSKLPDKTDIKGFSELRRYLAEDRIDQVAFSVLKHLATYGTGRTLTFNELEALKRDGVKLKPNGYRMQDLIRYVVNSPMFLEK